jgi:hypothetical protein
MLFGGVDNDLLYGEAGQTGSTDNQASTATSEASTPIS